MTDVTVLLENVKKKVPGAQDKLFAAVYDELRRMARLKMRRERSSHTLQATALVNEAYIRMCKVYAAAGEDAWENRRFFFAAASRAMRNILVERARRKKIPKAGGMTDIINFAGEDLPPLTILQIHEALEKLARIKPKIADLVELRYFVVGPSLTTCAEILGIDERTVTRHWAFARTWLHREIIESDSPPQN